MARDEFSAGREKNVSRIKTNKLTSDEKLLSIAPKTIIHISKVEGKRNPCWPTKKLLVRLEAAVDGKHILNFIVSDKNQRKLLSLGQILIIARWAPC